MPTVESMFQITQWILYCFLFLQVNKIEYDQLLFFLLVLPQHYHEKKSLVVGLPEFCDIGSVLARSYCCMMFNFPYLH